MPRKERHTLGEQAAKNIITYIQEENYQPGDKLPNEYEFSELLGVSRNTVREALRVLVSRNIVTIRQGAGTFVSEKKGVSDDPLGFTMVDDRVKLTKDLLQIRYIIEPSVAALAAQNATPEDLEKLKEILLEVEALTGQRMDFTEKDAEFHAQIANCTHNTVMSNLIPVINMGVEIFSSEISQREYEQTIRSHRSIYLAIRDKRAADAKEAMQFHLLYNSNRFMEEKVHTEEPL